MRLALLCLLAAAAAGAQELVKEVRAALAQGNLAAAEGLIQKYHSGRGVTPEMIEAVSWMGRAALAARQFDLADAYAAQTRKLVGQQLIARRLDAEPHLPLALGAAIEVEALALDGRGERGEAVNLLRRELKTYWSTSIRTRIQKNIHLLSLEGKPAPALDVSHWLGPKPPALEQLRGKAVALFFWAHWCSDCKKMIPDLARVAAEYGPKGLVLIGPTQHYGYMAGGVEAAPEQETAYIEAVRKAYYGSLAGMPAPVSEENFRMYGSNTSPTVVILDRKGVVRTYHPGAMTYPELVAGVRRALGE